MKIEKGNRTVCYPYNDARLHVARRATRGSLFEHLVVLSPQSIFVVETQNQAFVYYSFLSFYKCVFNSDRRPSLPILTVRLAGRLDQLVTSHVTSFSWKEENDPRSSVRVREGRLCYTFIPLCMLPSRAL